MANRGSWHYKIGAFCETCGCRFLAGVGRGWTEKQCGKCDAAETEAAIKSEEAA